MPSVAPNNNAKAALCATLVFATIWSAECFYSFRPSCTQSRASLQMMGRRSAGKRGFKYTGKLRQGTLSPTREVPLDIPRPEYAESGQPTPSLMRFPWDIEEKSPDQIAAMRRSGRLAREVLDLAGQAVRPGITTDEIDQIVHEAVIERGAYPSPLNYGHFPKSVCTSIDEVICHGIPDSTVLKEGMIINVDVTVYFEGYHGDCSEMFCVGEVDDDAKKLLKVTYDCWQKAISICKPGVAYKEIGGLIEDYIRPYGYKSVPDFCGHGIGSKFHCAPNVLHYKNNERNGVMKPGHTFTIEPMICEGSSKPVIWPDDWTATTKDGSRTAQFEHTLLITEDGVEALTAKLPTSMKQFWEE